MLSDGSMALFKEMYVEPVAFKRREKKGREEKRREKGRRNEEGRGEKRRGEEKRGDDRKEEERKGEEWKEGIELIEWESYMNRLKDKA